VNVLNVFLLVIGGEVIDWIHLVTADKNCQITVAQLLDVAFAFSDSCNWITVLFVFL
jgi:hypothetical protein